MMYEVCDSTDSTLPFSLQSVLSSLQQDEAKDNVHLFLSVVYVMMLESGFCPVTDDLQSVEGQDWRLQEKKLRNISYDVRRVRHYTQNFVPFKTPTDEFPFYWKFRISDFPHVTLIVDVIVGGPEKLVNLNVIVKGTSSGLTRCYKVSRYVPLPHAPTPADKFSNLRELSVDFKTLASLARGEAFFQEGVGDKTSFEYLPPHIHEEIAAYLPVVTLHNPPSAPLRVPIVERYRGIRPFDLRELFSRR